MKLNLHDPKTRQKALVGAGVGAAFVAFLAVRHKQNAAGGTATTASGTSSGDQTIDPVTGIPYALEGGTSGAGVTASGSPQGQPGPAGPPGPRGRRGRGPRPRGHGVKPREPKPKRRPPTNHQPEPRPRHRGHGHPQHPPGFGWPPVKSRGGGGGGPVRGA